MSKTNIAVISQNHFILEALKDLTTVAYPDVNSIIIDTARNANELNKIILAHPIDILMFAECSCDIVGISWYDRILELQKEHPNMKIILCSSVRLSKTYRFSALIDAFLFLDEPLSNLRKDISRILKRMISLSGGGVNANKKKSGLSGLEWKILKEVKTGACMQQISNRVNIPYRKISALKNNAMRKLGLRNHTELLIFLAR